MVPARALTAVLRFVLVLWTLGCGGTSDDGGERVAIEGPKPLLVGEAQRSVLCERPRSDLVIDALCGPERPTIQSLADLRALLGQASNVNDAWQGFAVIGHSTSLSGRGGSAINPRIIFARYPREQEGVEMLALAFTRGPQGKAADLLGISRKTRWEKRKRYGIT